VQGNTCHQIITSVYYRGQDVKKKQQKKLNQIQAASKDKHLLLWQQDKMKFS